MEDIRITCSRGVAYLDMTDPSQQCPPAWREYNTRACGRPVNETGSCAAIFFITNIVECVEELLAIKFLAWMPLDDSTTNSRDLDGIIISHGKQHNHIWSYAAGVTENSTKAIAHALQ